MISLEDRTPSPESDGLNELVRRLEQMPSPFSLSLDSMALYSPSGTILAFNDAARAMAGEELCGANFLRDVEPLELGLVRSRFAAALGGEQNEFETTFSPPLRPSLRLAVRLSPARFEDRIVGVFGFARDITALRESETIRARIQQQFETLFQQHPQPISMIDAEGRYVRINPAAETLLGYTNAEAAGKAVGRVGMGLTAERLESLDDFVAGALRSGLPDRFEFETFAGDGTRLVREGIVVPILDAERTAGLFVFSAPAAERKVEEEAAATLNPRGRDINHLLSEIESDPNLEASRLLALALREFGYESAAVVVDGNSLNVERSHGVPLSVTVADPVFEELCRRTIAAADMLEVHDAELEQRFPRAGTSKGFCRTFLGIRLDTGGGRSSALVFTTTLATLPLDVFDRETLRDVAELVGRSIRAAVESKRLRGPENFDALTGLANRSFLSERFQLAIASAERGGEQIAVYFIDVDKFKLINATYGHGSGNVVLRTIATRLKAACRSGDTIARVGGDQFVVLRTGPATGSVEAVAERVRAALDGPCEIDGLAVPFTVGIGISVFPQDGATERSLIERADGALGAAKASGDASIHRADSRSTPRRPARP